MRRLRPTSPIGRTICCERAIDTANRPAAARGGEISYALGSATQRPSLAKKPVSRCGGCLGAGRGESMIGRPPKSAALRLLEGHRGHRPIKTPPEPPQAAMRCPDWLDEVAKAEWRRVFPLLTRMRVMTALDVGMLASYCLAWSELRQSSELLQRRGRTFTTPAGYKQQRPESRNRPSSDARRSRALR